MTPTSTDLPRRPPERPSLVFHLAALAAAATTCALLMMGGNAQSKGWLAAALAQATGRYAGTFAGIITVAMALYLTRFRQAWPALARAGWGAVALTLPLLAWAMVAPALHLPSELGTLQNAGALALFLTVSYLAVGTAPWAHTGKAAAIHEGVRRAVLVAGVVMVSQMLLGALVRYAGATGQALWGDAEATRSIFVLHRLGSMATVALVAGSAVAMFSAAGSRPWLRGLAATVVALVIAQALLGVHAVAEALPLSSLQAHIGLGVALLGAQWGLYLGSASGPAHSRTFSLRALVRELVALTKPRISAMVIATFGGGLWLAPRAQETWRGLVALVGTLVIVGAANALNMYLERDIDARMKRTKNRPLPQGRLSADAAAAAGTALFCLSLPLLLIGANELTCVLGFAAFALYVFAYTPLKQKSSIALFVGAVPGALPPLMGWTTATNSLDLPGLVLFGILFLWQIPHFIAISVFRVEDYSRAGFKVMPDEYGMAASRAWALVCAVAMVATSLALTPLGVTGWLFATAAALLGGVFIAWTAAGYSGRARQGAGANRWGRTLFAYSIVYLMLLFMALTADRLLA